MIRGVLVLALLLPCAARAQEVSTVSLSMAEAIEKALRASEDVGLSTRRKEKLAGTYTRVRARAYPQLNGTVGWNRYADRPVQVADLGLGPQELELVYPYEFEVGATLTQVLWAFGKVSAAIDIAKEAIDIERLSHEATTNEVAFAARRAYLTILHAREALRIAEESHRNALENQEALHARVGRGRVSRVDNVKMAADVESRVPPKLEARSSLESLLISFRRLVGLPAGAPLVLTDVMDEDFPELARDDLHAVMAAQEPSLRAVRRRIDLNARIVSLRKADYLPTLSALASYRYYGNDVEPWPESPYTDPSLLIGVQLSVPLWDSGTRLGALREAARDKDMADLRYRKLRRDLSAALDTALSEYSSAVKVYRADHEALKLAEESYRIALSSFRSGKASQTQLNDAELQLTAAKLRAQADLFKIHLILARIDRLTARKGTL